MSVVAYWSPLQGQGQTSNLLISAYLLEVIYQIKILLTHTHHTPNYSQELFAGGMRHRAGEDRDRICQEIGLDAAIHFSTMTKLTYPILERCCVTSPDNSILVLPGSRIKNDETFQRDVGRFINRLADDMNDLVDLVMIDSKSGEDALSSKLLERADIIVINLSQRRCAVERLFHELDQGRFEGKRLFFLFGNYDDQSIFNLNNNRIRYHRYLKKENSGVIPHCTGFLDAQNSDKLYSFLCGRRNDGNKIYRERSDKEEYFFRQGQLMVHKLMKYIGSDKTGKGGKGGA